MGYRTHKYFFLLVAYGFCLGVFVLVTATPFVVAANENGVRTARAAPAP